MDNDLVSVVEKYIILELEGAYTYRQMANCLERHGRAELGERMRNQARQGVKHAVILFNYLKERGIAVRLDALRSRRQLRCRSIDDIKAKLLRKGRRIADGIDRLLRMAEKTADTSAALLLSWLAAVQLEEGAMLADALNTQFSPDPEDPSAPSGDENAKRQEDTIPTLLKTQRRHGVA